MNSDQMNISGFTHKKPPQIPSAIPSIMPNNFVSPNQGRAKSHFRGVTNAVDLLSNNSVVLAGSMTNSQMMETDRSTS